MSENRLIIEKDKPDKKISQTRARIILPILVRQAGAENTIYYGDLAKELGLHHRVLRTPLGCIGDTLLKLGGKLPEDIPPIQGLVVNKNTKLPGDNVNFLRHQKLESWQKKAIVKTKLEEVYNYPKWLDVLEELGLSPPESLNPQLEQPVSRRGGSAESEAHKRLKDYIAQHPKSIGLNKSLSPGDKEFVLPSGDIPDVLFQNTRRRIAVEVKSQISSETDIKRGIFQCVKYKAILKACRSVAIASYEVNALLAIEGKLTTDLIRIKNTLGVKVIEDIKVDASN